MKKMTILAIFVVALVTLTACSTSQTDNTKVSNNPENDRKGDFRRPDFGQPKETPDIQGLVSAIVGNEVTILKIEKPRFNEEDKNIDEDNNSKVEKSITMSGSSMPGIKGQKMGGDKQNMDEDAEAQRLEKIKEMTVGEETVLIPVGIQMLKPDTASDAERNTMVEASLENIEKDTMVQIWLNENITDRKIAKFVLITK